VLHETSTVIGRTTEPQLTTTWFSATYWRVAGIAAVLTLPFLFAAAVQALVQSDITLVIRAALGYLPLALLAVAIAAPMTMLLLSVSDQLAAIVSSAAGGQSAHFLNRESGLIGALTHAGASPFVGFFIALLTVAAALGLWIELMMRAAAVYVIVLLLPLAFAAFVWPARRVWVVRAVELLLALIVSKFVIVAVLALGGAALSRSATHSLVGLIAGLVLLVLGAFAPWALLRLLPVTEIASAAAGSLRHGGHAALDGAGRADAWADEAETWATKAAQMRREARASEGGDGAHTERERLNDGASADGIAVAPMSAASDDTGPEERADPPSSTSQSPPPPADVATPAGSPELGGRHAAERPTELSDLLEAGRELRPVALGPDDLRPLAPELEGDAHEQTADSSPLDHPDPTPAPQDPRDGRL
jgi:hypothetical protein